MSENGTSDREVVIRRLHRERPRSRFTRASILALAALVAYSWWAGGFHLDDLFSERRRANFVRFLTELEPYPLQGEAWDWGAAASWAAGVLAGKGWPGAVATLAISVVAIVLAALASLPLAAAAARTFATPEPYLPRSRPPPPALRFAWAAVVGATRTGLIFLRSIPEYLWAFLLIAVVGPSAWPAVLALALHNAGILGKLDAEVVENLSPGPLKALRGTGAGRGQLAAVGVFPAVLPRLLLFFFYRWETCVREATVLGMLGIVSLGFFIQDARARNLYDELFLLILVGSAIVLAGDLVSALAREAVRRGR